MITNAKDLYPHQKRIMAEKISALSQRTNSSLLQKTAPEIIELIESGIVYVKIEESHILFSIAFEPTPHPDFIEVGMTCNLEDELIRGKDVFPAIIKYYRQINGNGKKTLYLTTTNSKLISISKQSGFREISDIRNLFPAEVLDFCCSPCKKEKTGVLNQGEQIWRCPRFLGEFIPQQGEFLTRNPCTIFAQKL